MSGVGLKDSFVALVGNKILSNSVRYIVPDMPSMYALLPCEQKWRNYLSYVAGSPLVVPQFCTTYEATIDKLSDYLSDWNDYTLAKTRESQNKLFINGVHVTQQYNFSYYIIGNNESTTQSIHFDNLRNFHEIKTDEGDGTVPLWSATIGNSLPSGRSFIKESNENMSALHQSLASGKFVGDRGIEKEDLTTIQFVKEIIAGTFTQYSESQLKNNFGLSPIVQV